MSRVSYQVRLDPADHAPPSFRGLEPGAIATRRKDATATFRVALSKSQARWLRGAAGSAGGRVDEGAVVRAMVDLAMELDVDWSALDRPGDLRAAIRDAVLVRRRR